MEYKREKIPPHGHGAGGLGAQGASGEPLFLASPAAQVTSGDLADLKNLSGTNTGDQDLSNLVVGPSSAVDLQRVRFNGVTGKLVEADGRSIYDASCETFDVATEDFIDLFSMAATVAVGETIEIDCILWICNRSGAARYYNWQLLIGDEEALLDPSGSISISTDDTSGITFPIRIRVFVGSTSLAYVHMETKTSSASQLGAVGAADMRSAMSVTKITSDITGAKTIKFRMHSSSTTDTQTCVLLGWRMVENLP